MSLYPEKMKKWNKILEAFYDVFWVVVDDMFEMNENYFLIRS